MNFILIALLSSALCFAQTATLSGTLVDATGAPVPDALIRLTLTETTPSLETKSGPRGDFAFPHAPLGPYRLSFTAPGFAANSVTGELTAGQNAVLALTAFAIDPLKTTVNVTQTTAEIAQDEIKIATQQRIGGLIPNFFTVYNLDAAPLNSKQKLELAGRSLFDPATFVINGMIAGVGQAQNTNKGFGQGAQGYAKRYGAGFVSYGTGLVIEKVVLTTLTRQDPRYFVKGTGSGSSRALWAISRTVICRGDNKKFQFCYSSLANRFGTGFVTRNFFPASARDSNAVLLRSSAIGLGIEAIGNLFQEFLSKKATRRRK